MGSTLSMFKVVFGKGQRELRKDGKVYVMGLDVVSSSLKCLKCIIIIIIVTIIITIIL